MLLILHRHLRFDVRVRVVVLQFEVFKAEVEQVSHFGVELHLWHGSRLAGELEAGLLEVVAIEVGVAEGVDEFAGREAAHLRHHHGEQGVAGDVEGHAEEDVGAALVELAGEAAFGYVKLEHGVAGGQRHFIDEGGIPGGYDEAAAVGIAFDLPGNVGDLVDMPAVGGGPGAPLVAVYGAEVAVFVGPFVPDGDVVFFQVADVGVAFEKPKELVDDGAQVELFGGEQGEALGEVEAHLVPEYGTGAGAGAVGFVGAVAEDVLHEVEVGLHGVIGLGVEMGVLYTFGSVGRKGKGYLKT